MAAKVVLERSVALDACDGESFAAGETRDELGVGAAWQLEAGTYRWSRIGAPIGGPQLDEPGAVGGRRREPELQRLLAEAGLDRGCKRRRDVDDEQVARRQDPWKVAETGVGDREIVTRRDEQGDVVAAFPAYLRRLVRLQPRVELERAHASTLTSSRAR